MIVAFLSATMLLCGALVVMGWISDRNEGDQ